MTFVMLDLTGKKFARLTAVWPVGRNAGREIVWLFACECGRLVVRSGISVRTRHIGSCGCLKRELCAQKFRDKRKYPAGTLTSPTYKSWAAAKERCFRKEHEAFARYGGRGITMCERWLTFKNFLADMGERPPGTSLDRYPNNDGNYEPGNCRWATIQEQNKNRRRPKPYPRATKTHCARGHAFTGTNLRIKTYRGRPVQCCLACHRERQREYRQAAKGSKCD